MSSRRALLMGRNSEKNAYIIEVDTRLTADGSTANNQMILPLGYETLIPGSGYILNSNFKVDWGDGVRTFHVNKFDNPIHTYATAGIYTIKLYPPSGTYVAISSDGNSDRQKIKRVLQFGKRSFIHRNAFYECVNLTLNDLVDLPTVVYSMFQTFRITTMINLVPLIDSWDTSNITEMSGTFRAASAFNQYIGSWNTSNVTSMDNMFRAATAFNQDITSWDVSNVTNMTLMFNAATAFNQNISLWNFNKEVNLASFLNGASSFSSENYDNLLIKLASVMIGSGRVAAKILGATGVRYTSAGATARAALVADGWTISDGGLI